MFDNIPGWLAVALSLCTLAYTVLDNRAKKMGVKIRDIEHKVALKADALEVGNIAESIDQLQDRTTRIEKEMEHLPSKDATHRLELALTGMQGEMSMLAERIKPIAAMSSRLQEKLIDTIGRD